MKVLPIIFSIIIMARVEWKHPGTMMSPAMTWALRDDIGKSVLRCKALDAMIKDCPLDYKARALETVSIDWGGKGTGHDECTKDGEMCYRSALLSWAIKDDGKCAQYGYMGVRIIGEWAAKNKVFTGNNAPLEAAWSVCSMARAGELLKHHHIAGVQEAWKRVEKAFLGWLDRVIMPVLRTEALWRWPVKGNWHYSILCARAQIAILREDTQEWTWCIKKYKETLPLSIGAACGCHWFTAETLRDMTHAMFLIGGLLQLPEMALHQGDGTLWDDRLAGVLENHAAIMLREVPAGIQAEQIKTPYGWWVEPVFEVGCAHFVQRKKRKMPKLEALLGRVRPERVTFHWGGGTLTHSS